MLLTKSIFLNIRHLKSAFWTQPPSSATLCWILHFQTSLGFSLYRVPHVEAYSLPSQAHSNAMVGSAKGDMLLKHVKPSPLQISLWIMKISQEKTCKTATLGGLSVSIAIYITYDPGSLSPQFCMCTHYRFKANSKHKLTLKKF